MIQLYFLLIVGDAIERDFGAVVKCESDHNELHIQGGQNNAVHRKNDFNFNLAPILICLSIQMQIIGNVNDRHFLLAFQMIYSQLIQCRLSLTSKHWMISMATTKKERNSCQTPVSHEKKSDLENSDSNDNSKLLFLIRFYWINFCSWKQTTFVFLLLTILSYNRQSIDVEMFRTTESDQKPRKCESSQTR